ncbi:MULTISPECIES: hypothetical protein [Halomicrobium]|uniref:Uncharacterized protein n=2 Tax=Halomicrobium mukohataei TaxID=57705 RepID=C7P2F0_HALMD|nr:MULTISPECIES: hypothetical protein [Halomicrobium]ACV49265.1 conserved hypothetical protein [Halomicrobium mukohataei DSM 12286]QCD64666.1 hypothetical protein E5139_03030 [Halomicrobium mukohataei]QFR19473.1 hypothetical protein GBQ70_03030 [Halomicrobium sp. ZPS1]
MSGPSFDGQEVLDETLSFLGSLPPEQITAMRDAVYGDLGRYEEADCTYFVLGNYDEYEKERVLSVRDSLTDSAAGRVAFTLEDIDPGVDAWQNFYVKFRVFARRADHIVLVAEDNDGGHKLELGEVDRERLYVLKRDYDGASLDPPDDDERSAADPAFGDLDYERFDAMMLTLFAYLDDEGRLFTWASESGLARAVDRVLAETI